MGTRRAASDQRGGLPQAALPIYPLATAGAIERRRCAETEVVDVSEKYLEDFAVGQTYGSGRLDRRQGLHQGVCR